MTTKDPSRKQIIIPMNINNFKRVITQANKHISNINKLLKGVKSNVYADYIHFDNKEIITTNNVISSWILQFKSYLKILDILGRYQPICYF